MLTDKNLVVFVFGNNLYKVPVFFYCEFSWQVFPIHHPHSKPVLRSAVTRKQPSRRPRRQPLVVCESCVEFFQVASSMLVGWVCSLISRARRERAWFLLRFEQLLAGRQTSNTNTLEIHILKEYLVLRRLPGTW